MRELIPWWGRIAGKVLLTRLPVDYGLWHRLGVFRHGAMHDPTYALRVFREHFVHARTPRAAAFTALELGPGDSLSSAVIAAAHGASHTYLVDAGAFATTDLTIYRQLGHYLQGQQLQPPDLDSVHDTAGLLKACRASYGTRGIASLREIPSGSVDFAWSQATLEHVRHRDFAAIIGESRRLMRPEGICSHEIDLKDHLGGALNNLRIPSRWWESEWMARSGFYTNRLRMGEILQVFRSAGFEVLALTPRRWSAPPTPLGALAREFRDHDPADLLVSSFSVVLRAA